MEDYQKLPQKDLPIWDNKGNLIGKLIDYEPESYDAIKDQWICIWILGKTFKDNIVPETTFESRIRKQLFDTKWQFQADFDIMFSDWKNADCMSDYMPPDSLQHPDLKYRMIYSKNPLSWNIQAIFVFEDDHLLAIEIERKLDLPLIPVLVKSRYTRTLYFIANENALKSQVVGAIKYFFDFAG